MQLLKLYGLEECNECHIEFDYYVHYSVEIYSKRYTQVNEKNVYWRTGDIDQSLVEIGIDSRTGVLRNLTLTAVKNAILGDVIVIDNRIMEGIPVFDISMIPEKGIYDCVKDFHVFLGKEAISTIIGEIDKCRTLIRFGRIDIGFDLEDYITHVTVNNLTADEYAELKESLKL